MKVHALKGKKQTVEHIRKRMEAVAKAKAAWTDGRRTEYSEKIRAANLRRDPEIMKKFMYSNIGREPWCKGKKIPQISGSNHWNWGNNMPQESIEKMRQSLTGKKQTPEVIKKRFDARAGYSPSPETRAKIGNANRREKNGMFYRIGSLNPTWKGGVSFEPYPTTWTFRLREAIRDRDGRICQVCGKEESRPRLDVHHIDYDKNNINHDNLISLCHPCHMRTIYDRDQWIIFFNWNQYFNQPCDLTGTDN